LVPGSSLHEVLALCEKPCEIGAMSGDRGRQKSLAKHKKKRELVKKKEAQRRLAAPSLAESLIRRASTLPHGPTYISSNWSDDSQSIPSLVSIVVTRQMPDGTLMPGVALVDRTCLGVKNGFVGRPVTRSELDGFLARMDEAQGGMEACELLVAQSVVFHALDYARSLGFQPNPDFSEPFFGPRPDALLATPYCRPEKPIYVSGPDDDVGFVLAQLNKVVGPGNYELTAALTPGLLG
jgi:hypothetical protein